MLIAAKLVAQGVQTPVDVLSNGLEGTVLAAIGTPVERRPDLALAWDNLAPVCTACHARCNALERRGETTAHMFAGFVRRPQFGGLD